MSPFMHLKHLLNVYYTPHIILGAGEAVMNQTDQIPAPRCLHSEYGKENNILRYIICVCVRARSGVHTKSF